MSEYKEFWIDNSNETNKDFFLYNVKRGVMNYNFQGAIHVIEYSAYEQANERIKELEREIEKLKSTLVETKNKIISIGIIAFMICIGFFIAGFAFAVRLINKSVGLK